MTDLCQCPFCGSAPRVYQTEYRIMCSSQSCPVRPSVFSNDLNVAEVRWNSRPEINAADVETGEVYKSPADLMADETKELFE